MQFAEPADGIEARQTEGERVRKALRHSILVAGVHGEEHHRCFVCGGVVTEVGANEGPIPLANSLLVYGHV
jgi:hypothetical protein